MMITRNKDFGYFPSPKVRRPCVVGMFDQLHLRCGIREGIPQNWFFFPHTSPHVASYCIDDNDSRNPSSRYDEVTDRDFRRCQVFDNAFINTFITAADQNSLICLRETKRLGLIKAAARGAEHDYFDGRKLLLSKRFDRIEDRFGLENHAFATSERPIINGAVPIGSEIPKIVDVNLKQPLLTAAPDNSVTERTVEELREYSDDVKNHLFRSRSPSGKSTSIRR